MAKKKVKNLILSVVAVIVLLNILIAIHSYKLTHFDEDAPSLAYTSLEISFLEKLKVALFGIDIPKPKAKVFPKKYEQEQIPLQTGEFLSAWRIHTDSLKKGVVLMFHGYMDEKSSMIERAEILKNMGYDVLLVDFFGSGDSPGNRVTIGYLEAEDVLTTFNYEIQKVSPDDKIFLFGFSMGASAIIKAQHDNLMAVDGLILEASYSSLKKTIESRAKLLNLPKEPASSLFTFWIGVVNGFNGFSAEPIKFAKSIDVPVLIMCGAEDQYISIEETKAIYDAIRSEQKNIYLFPESKHESYLLKNSQEWENQVSQFLIDKD